MHLVDGTLVLSATDLTGYLACEHLTGLDRAVAEGRIPAVSMRAASPASASPR